MLIPKDVLKKLSELANLIKGAKAFKALLPLELPSILFDIAIGLMLGDASAVKRYPNSSAVLKFTHTANHLDYIIHLFDLFSLWVASPPRLYEIVRSTGTFLQIGFQSLSFPWVDQLRSIFYDDQGRKRVPSNIAFLLTPIGLAFFFMDDGAKAGKGFLLHTDGFTKEDVALLASVLEAKFGLKCSLRRRHQGQFAIYISAHSRGRFISIVGPYIHPSMRYKIS